MRIIYMHHAERNIGQNHNDPILRQEEDITETGIEECELLGKEFIQNTNNYNIKAIVTSPYLRCKHTAEIINKYLNVPIIEDERFNECQSKEEMHSGKLWKRIMAGIDAIVKSNRYSNNDDILIVTSGVNLTGFVCYFYNIDPESHPRLSQGTFCSPVNFIYEKENRFVYQPGDLIVSKVQCGICKHNNPNDEHKCIFYPDGKPDRITKNEVKCKYMDRDK